MGSLTPLKDRIREAEQRRQADLRYLRPAVVTPFRPRWLDRAAKDLTASIYSNGQYVPAGEDGGA